MIRTWEVISAGILIGLAVANAGCVETVGLSAGTVMLTDKTVVDHAVSAMSGKDCATVRKEAGLSYCKEDELVAVQDTYCYRTLGDVTCYEQRDPYNGRQRRVEQTVSVMHPSQVSILSK